jgi:SAM-dependent methyltransferase
MNHGALAKLAAWIRDWVDLEKSSLDRAIEHAAGSAGGKLLDVGCGDKPYEAVFAPHVDSHIGVEYGDTYRNSFSARLARADVLYDGRILPFANATFQTVLSTQVLEHVPDPWGLVREMVRVLAPGGRLILTVPFSYRIHSAPDDFHRFTGYALEVLAHGNGLEIECLAHRGGFWFVMGQKLNSHLAFRWARLDRAAQEMGTFGYRELQPSRPRWWTLPFLVPVILVSSTLARMLDRLDPDPSETLGYLLVARKP